MTPPMRRADLPRRVQSTGTSRILPNARSIRSFSQNWIEPENCRLSRPAGDHPAEKAQFAQHARRVGPKHHSRADLAELRSPFINGCLDAGLFQRDGGGDAADAAAYNRDTFCRKNSPVCFSTCLNDAQFRARWHIHYRSRSSSRTRASVLLSRYLTITGVYSEIPHSLP